MDQLTRGTQQNKAYYHLPGLFEFFELYSRFLPLYYGHREYFYDWCEIGSIYGSPMDCLWGGGRVEAGETDPVDVLNLLRKYGISPRFTFSNSLLSEEHLSDVKCNRLCSLFSAERGIRTGVIIYSNRLLSYLKKHFPDLYFISSTTKVLTYWQEFEQELKREEFAYVVPDFRLNKALPQLETLSAAERSKVEFLVNECCSFDCPDRKACYEDVSRKNLGIEGPEHICNQPGGTEGYRFSRAMKNPGFIGTEDIQKIYLPMGFEQFKIEGRGLGSAVVLEFLLYYMTKPEYELIVREEMYLDSMLDLF